MGTRTRSYEALKIQTSWVHAHTREGGRQRRRERGEKRKEEEEWEAGRAEFAEVCNAQAEDGEGRRRGQKRDDRRAVLAGESVVFRSTYVEPRKRRAGDCTTLGVAAQENAGTLRRERVGFPSKGEKVQTPRKG